MNIIFYIDLHRTAYSIIILKRLVTSKSALRYWIKNNSAYDYFKAKFGSVGKNWREKENRKGKDCHVRPLLSFLHQRRQPPQQEKHTS